MCHISRFIVNYSLDQRGELLVLPKEGVVMRELQSPTVQVFRQFASLYDTHLIGGVPKPLSPARASTEV